MSSAILLTDARYRTDEDRRDNPENTIIRRATGKQVQTSPERFVSIHQMHQMSSCHRSCLHVINEKKISLLRKQVQTSPERFVPMVLLKHQMREFLNHSPATPCHPTDTNFLQIITLTTVIDVPFPPQYRRYHLITSKLESSYPRISRQTHDPSSETSGCIRPCIALQSFRRKIVDTDDNIFK